MKKNRIFCKNAILLSCVFSIGMFFASTTNSADISGISSAMTCSDEGITSQQKAQILKLINKAQVHIGLNGIKKSCEDFTNLKGEFVDGSNYVFIMDKNRNIVASGGNPEIIGKNVNSISRDAGKLVYNTAKKGGGWVSYFWENPTNHNLECKTAWVTPFLKDENGNIYYLGTGVYHTNNS